MIIDNITSAYNENAPEFIYFMMLYNVFSEFLDDLSEDVLPNEATGFKQSKIWSMLYDFQKDAVLAIINKLEKYNGCILADSVGLGKTFTALAVIKYYENQNKTVLVLCPKKLSENWNTYKDNYVKVTYRPFDDRYIYYCPEMVDWGRFDLMNTLGRQDNIALVVTRQAITDNWANAFLSKEIVDDSMVSNRTKERGYVFPLYLDNGFPNISSDFLNKIAGTTGLSFSKRPSETTFDAMKVFDYIYAILFSNKYRSMYKDQLKADFPHIPVPSDRSVFLGFHTLFDGGYITIDEDYRIDVSRRLHEDYGNGRDYYKYHGQKADLSNDQK